jgi:hypothetical protein
MGSHELRELVTSALVHTKPTVPQKLSQVICGAEGHWRIVGKSGK